MGPALDIGQIEALHFDFGSVVADDRYPEEDEIRQIGDLESR